MDNILHSGLLERKFSHANGMLDWKLSIGENVMTVHFLDFNEMVEVYVNGKSVMYDDHFKVIHFYNLLDKHINVFKYNNRGNVISKILEIDKLEK